MFAELLSQPPFVIMLTGALVGVAAALVGCFLVLRGNSMLSDAISHTVIFGIVIVWLLTGQISGPVQVVGAALTGVFTVMLIEALTQTRRVRQDAAIGLVFPVLFAVGVLLLNLYARDVHVDEHTVLLGEIGFVWLETTPLGGVEVPTALLAMAAVTLVNALFVGLFYKELKIATFDPQLAQALGFAPALLFYALLLLTSTTAVAAFDAVGVVLFIAFVIVPPSAAYLLTDRLDRMLLYAMAIGMLSSPLGYAAAIALNVSIGGMMALMTGVCLLLALVAGPRHGMLVRWRRQRRQALENALRTLAVHLYQHEAGPQAAEESRTAALNDHLMWSPGRVEATLSEATQRGLVARQDGHLALTDRGRRLAREILEPWQGGR
ncbi:metal ABC transporter permease [Spiribacter halobius]|uniref:Zinc ABC transporter permease n=1 Tax=Sediminicurvatus halobius TaxID=2182432 RepID=A0A2U2MXQ7_9GAMM|nr:metal ABC transporter permease [Spiribacter halobius]PWG61563.1 zinc ABC transporter permease [Spiribacter halobius]UEX77131.1 metal ABC transporter permease [Spiribacter halobius]